MSSFNRYERTSAGDVFTANSTDVIIGIIVANTHATATLQCDITLSGTDLVKDLRVPVGVQSNWSRERLSAKAAML